MSKSDAPQRRRERLLGRFRRERIDSLLVMNVHNVRYLSGFRGDDSALLVTPPAAFLLTDSRYAEQAGQETRGLRIVVRKKGMMRAAAATAHKTGGATLGVEAATMTLAQADELRKSLRGTMIRETRGLVEGLRVVKDAGEIAAIRRAAEIAQEAFQATLPQLAPGKTEREMALLLERAMEDLGAEGPAFPSIVASGPRSSLPHARPTDRRIRRGEAVLFDWGARWQGYHSDLTRVVFLDRIAPPLRNPYSAVLEAQRRAIAQVRPGRRGARIDSIARAYLKAHRHGKHFGHGLGHGVGLEIHEAPGIAPGQDGRLRAGMVITVEPGVYLPGLGGIRIEDLVLVTRKGHELLTSLPRSLESSVVRP